MMRKGLHPLFALLFLILLFSSCGQVSSSLSRAKVMIVGVDGADWSVVNPMIAQGKLPNFARLQESGVKAPLKSINPLRSPLIWTSIATGKIPEKHGIYDFVVDREKDDMTPVTRNLRKVKAFWNILSEKGIRVGIVGWLITWPVEEVNGYMVSSYLSFVHSKKGKAGLDPARDFLPNKGTIEKDIPYQFYPEGLSSTLLAMKRPPASIPYEDLQLFLNELPSPQIARRPLMVNQLENLRWILSADEAYSKIGLYLQEKFKPKVSAVYFGGTDLCGHRFWKYFDRSSPFWDADPWPEEEQRIFSGVYEGYYRYIDKLLETYMEVAGEDTLLMVLSDHGMTATPKYLGKPAPSGQHREEGLLLLKGPGVKKGAEIQAGILDITPTLLYYLGLPVAKDMDGKILRDAFKEEFLKSRPDAFVATYEEEGKRKDEQKAKKSIVDKQIEEHLRSLGYIQ